MVGDPYIMLHVGLKKNLACLAIVKSNEKNEQASQIAGRIIYGDAILITEK